MTEIRDVVGWEGRYLVSDDGVVYSNRRGKITPMKTWKSKDGYELLELGNTTPRTIAKVHRLVAQAFIPNPENLPEVNHKDENPSNNRMDNLEWCTGEYNRSYGHIKEKIAMGHFIAYFDPLVGAHRSKSSNARWHNE